MRIIDLSQYYSNDMPIYPGLARPKFHDFARFEVDGYGMSEYHFINHTGTHIDAPSHHSSGPTLDDIPLERLVTDAVVLDFSQHAPGTFTRAELEPHMDRIRPGDFVLIYSNNARNWGTDQYWTGWCYPDAGATQALIERDISGIGFDGPSADAVDSTTFPLHKIWLTAGRLIIENMTNLDQLPERCLLVVAPMKVRAANGAPARIFALIS
ncbi:MAG TPA: cyclase family protein [Ktedonobacteraceae bacterium]|jgi:kynurenine formamidase|nr:cyclase family protein [Ktedonobacteraceae bacterium]